MKYHGSVSVSASKGTTASALPQPAVATPADAPEYSVVIPVFNSVGTVGETTDACLRFFRERELRHEVILVDDGSRDGTWQVLAAKAAASSAVVAIRLLRNYGQHTAVYCGLQHSRGRYVVTLDDDLQNPPEEIARLIEPRFQADAVFGQYVEKHHPLLRRLGSKIVDRLNVWIFGQPRGLVASNFRLLHRSVVNRMLAYRTRQPYINGLVVLCAARPVNVPVEHRRRMSGKSGYGVLQIAALVGRILFNYSSFPLRVVSIGGLVVALGSLLLSTYFAAHAVLVGSRVPGWASLAVLLSFFNGVSLLLLGMLGEYLVHTLDQVSGGRPYEVVQVLRDGECSHSDIFEGGTPGQPTARSGVDDSP